MSTAVRSIMRASIIASALVVATGLAAARPDHSSKEQADSRIPVRTADDLPRHTYRITGTALETIRDDAAFTELLTAVVRDANEDLQKYRIEDTATLKSYYSLLSTAAALDGNWEEALAWTEREREIETKDAEKLMSGLTIRARIAANKSAGGDPEKFPEAFKTELYRLVEPLPYELVKDRLISVYNTASYVTPDLIEASIASQIDPIIQANKGEISAGIAVGLITNRFALDVGLPLLPLMAETYGRIIEANANRAQETDLWTPRLVALDPGRSATPVVVGVWDTGVDTSLFEGLLWTNTSEKPNGRDDDGNGFVDDLHGITFDLAHNPTAGPLADISELRGDLDTYMRYVAASMAMQAGEQNEQTAELIAKFRSLTQEQIVPFSEDIALVGSYCHGTHVAGITVAGNPFARIVHVTENFPFRSIPENAPTSEEYKRWGESNQQAVDYLRASGARVVNMSWRIPRAAVEAMLESKGVGASREERAALSREIFAEFSFRLERAIASAPEILFVAGAGNEDNDLDFNEYVPAGLRLDNLVTVSAVDNKDKPTSFTSFGKNVILYANGYRIESVVPGGARLEFSGTSMSAPQVTNLAAKLFAIDPSLTPKAVLQLITSNADPLPDHEGRLIINPKRTVETLLGSR